MRGNKLIYESVDFRGDHENLLTPYLVLVTVYSSFRDEQPFGASGEADALSVLIW